MNKFEQLVHLVGFIIRIYNNVQSHEHQNQLRLCPGNPSLDFSTVLFRNVEDVSHCCVVIGAARFCSSYHL